MLTYTTAPVEDNSADIAKKSCKLNSGVLRLWYRLLFRSVPMLLLENETELEFMPVRVTTIFR